MKNGTGVDIKISKSQTRKAVMEGDSLSSSLFSLGTKLLPYAVPALTTGALSGLANIGVDKIFGKGQVGGFLIPQNKVDQLIKYKDWLTEAQNKQISNSYRRTSCDKTYKNTIRGVSWYTSCKYRCPFTSECIDTS